MKFVLDMGISPRVAKFLLTHGHDAIHLFDVQLSRAADPDNIEFARQSERIILTHDLDFGALMAISGERLPSVMIFRLTDMKPANVNQYLEVAITKHADELVAG